MIKSNITLTSNIYPVNGLINTDREFLKHVEGKKALEIINLHSDYRQARDFTQEQNVQWEYGTKCYFNEDDDYTLGLVLIDGHLKKACRCLNQLCKNFKSCRPDFSEDELKHIIFKDNSRKLDEKDEFTKQLDLPEPKDYIEDNRDVESNNDFINNKEKQINIEGIIDFWNKLKHSKTEEEQKKDKKEDPEQNEYHAVNLIPSESKKKTKVKNKIQNIVKQKFVIEASEDTKLLVNAGPGTGKTYTLIERLKYLTDNCRLVPAQEMLLLCFSKAAIAEIRKRIGKAIESGQANDDLRFLDIRTFDSFATYVITQLDEEGDLSDKSYEDRIRIATNIIEINNDIFGDLKHFIVDEIQDLVGERAKLVQAILKASKCGFTLLGDSCQSIYDYQIEDRTNDIDSVKFYKWLEDTYENQMLKVEFEGNHRQTQRLNDMTYVIRTSLLLEEELNEKIEKIANVLNEIHSIGKCSALPPEILNSSITTCFLCRNNGEVLKLSQHLRNQGIPHSIQKPSTSRLIESWLGSVLGEYDRDTIDYYEFREAFNRVYPNVEVAEIQKKWNTLRNLDRDDRSRLTIKNVLTNIYLENSLINDLFISDNSNIVVSTVHRAKGREYERVILLGDSFKRLLERNDEVNVEEEVKTFYVAITRPIQEINTTEFSRKIYLRPVKGSERRWMETGKNRFKKWKYISGFEVGTEKDISKSSFIDINIFGNEESVLNNQIYIRTKVEKGDEIILRKADVTDNLMDSIYIVYHKDRVIGSMSKNFTYQLINALKQINNFYFINKLPLEIHESYVDEVVTYTSKDINAEVSKVYRKTHLWNGISLVGFGTLKWDESDL